MTTIATFLYYLVAYGLWLLFLTGIVYYLGRFAVKTRPDYPRCTDTDCQKTRQFAGPSSKETASSKD